MKIADVSWGWTPTPEQLPEGDSLLDITRQIRQIGFEEIDYLATDEGLESWFTPENCRRLGDYARSIGIVPNVMVYQAAKPWNTPDLAEREHLLRHFESCARAAKQIGCRIISTLAPKPLGATPWRLNPRASAQKEAFHLPDDYCFEKDWAQLRENYTEALKIAKKYGLRMSIECFIFSMVSTPQAMTRLLGEIGDEDFGIQLDTNHLIAQRIDPEWAIHMLGGKAIFNVHCKDHDMLSRGNIPAGCGITDYTEVIRALRAVGYTGNLTVELEFTDNPARYNRQAYEHLLKCLRGEY